VHWPPIQPLQVFAAIVHRQTAGWALLRFVHAESIRPVTTLADLTNRLRGRALDRPMVDFLATTSLNNTDVSSAFTVADGAFLAAGGIADFDDGTFEACLVATKPTQATGTFQRGWESVTAAHVAGARIRCNPRYRMFQYREAVNMALAAIGAGFRRDVWDTTQSFSPTVTILRVPAAAVRFMELMEMPSNTTSLRRVPARWMGSAPTSVASTGNAVRLTGRNPGTGTAYIHYQDVWPTLSATSDTLDPDFPTDAEDLIMLGAQAYLLDADAFSLVAFQEPHVDKRQFGSHLGDVRGEFATVMQRFITRRTEVASSRPQRTPTWMRGV
jgi:hypothetical protein